MAQWDNAANMEQQGAYQNWAQGLPGLSGADVSLVVKPGENWDLLPRERLLLEMEVLAEDVGQILLDKCREYSSVTFLSLGDLVQMGHPYAIRYPAGSAGYPDYLVSLRSGSFHGGFVSLVTRTQEGAEVSVFNTSAVAEFLLGPRTPHSKMRQRPILDAALEHTEREQNQALEDLYTRVGTAL
jgi:hypothetical protein